MKLSDVKDGSEEEVSALYDSLRELIKSVTPVVIDQNKALSTIAIGVMSMSVAALMESQDKEMAAMSITMLKNAGPLLPAVMMGITVGIGLAREDSSLLE